VTDAAWTLADIGDQTGRTALVTGPSPDGLGHHVALELARRGARVVLAGRDPAKVAATAELIARDVPDARLERLTLDLADLGAVRRAAKEAAELGPLHLLVNNAGVMAPPYSRTADGLELQMATNHFGPFLLTALLLPQLAAAGTDHDRGGRVVVVSSNGHRMARSAPLGDPLTSPRRYARWPQYGQTKLANLLFAYELDRRLRAAGLPVKALAAHPGFAGTHLVVNGQLGRASGGIASVLHGAVQLVSQTPAAGAWPVLMAATADLPGSTYCGPSGPGEWRGPAQVTTSSGLSHDREAQRRLWELSEHTVGLPYP
jgi:NAD(P)-dependent dehydrogenase (short-subunit alcohol dehydrogenase family)